MEVQQLLTDYTQTYQKLYQRYPREAVDLGNGWVLINGARMTAAELTQLTAQLHKEFEKVRANRRTVVNRLLKWFTTPQATD